MQKAWARRVPWDCMGSPEIWDCFLGSYKQNRAIFEDYVNLLDRNVVVLGLSHDTLTVTTGANGNGVRVLVYSQLNPNP